jgi:hypothetical protein
LNTPPVVSPVGVPTTGYVTAYVVDIVNIAIHEREMNERDFRMMEKLEYYRGTGPIYLNPGGGSVRILASYSMIIAAFCSFGMADRSGGRANCDDSFESYTRK